MNMLTVDDLKAIAPPRLRGIISDEMCERLNEITDDPDMAKSIRENMLTYSNVLKSSRHTLEDYANAIKYCSFKLAGMTNLDAYARTFPERYQRQVSRGTSQKDLNSLISSYNRNKIVTSILEQAFIPVWLLNQEYFQEAIHTQAVIMRTARSEKVRSDAANSLLNHLKPPEKSKLEIDMTVKQSSHVDDLRRAVLELTHAQQQAIRAGNARVIDVAEAKVIGDGSRESSE